MKRCRLAMVALLLGITSFVNLLGLEKGIVAILVGWLAIREIKEDPARKGKRMAWAGLILGLLSVIIIIFMLIWKGPQLLQQLRLLETP
jgi:hypothetical protein